MFVVVALLVCAQERRDCLQWNFEQSLFPLRESRAKRTGERACVENCRRVETVTRAPRFHMAVARVCKFLSLGYPSVDRGPAAFAPSSRTGVENVARVFSRSLDISFALRATHAHTQHTKLLFCPKGNDSFVRPKNTGSPSKKEPLSAKPYLLYRQECFSGK